MLFKLTDISSTQFTSSDAGYTATDYVLRQLLSQLATASVGADSISSNSECLYISVTNGDNIYGSEVVERVLHAAETAKGQSYSPGGLGVDMILNPLDSRNFAEQGDFFLFVVYPCLLTRRATAPPIRHQHVCCAYSYNSYRLRMFVCIPDILSSNLVAIPFLNALTRSLTDYVYRKEKKKNDWSTRCHGIQAMLFLNRLAYTTQPIPIVGGVDLASVFLNREKLAQEWLFFSK